MRYARISDDLWQLQEPANFHSTLSPARDGTTPSATLTAAVLSPSLVRSIDSPYHGQGTAAPPCRVNAQVDSAVPLPPPFKAPQGADATYAPAAAAAAAAHATASALALSHVSAGAFTQSPPVGVQPHTGGAWATASPLCPSGMPPLWPTAVKIEQAPQHAEAGEAQMRVPLSSPAAPPLLPAPREPLARLQTDSPLAATVAPYTAVLQNAGAPVPTAEPEGRIGPFALRRPSPVIAASPPYYGATAQPSAAPDDRGELAPTSGAARPFSLRCAEAHGLGGSLAGTAAKAGATGPEPDPEPEPEPEPDADNARPRRRCRPGSLPAQVAPEVPRLQEGDIVPQPAPVASPGPLTSPTVMISATYLWLLPLLVLLIVFAAWVVWRITTIERRFHSLLLAGPTLHAMSHVPWSLPLGSSPPYGTYVHAAPFGPFFVPEGPAAAVAAAPAPVQPTAATATGLSPPTNTVALPPLALSPTLSLSPPSAPMRHTAISSAATAQQMAMDTSTARS
jgi:hypothetical protein